MSVFADESAHTQLDVLRLSVRRQVDQVYSRRINDLTSALEQSQLALTAANIAQTNAHAHSHSHTERADKCECASLTSRLSIALDELTAARALNDRLRLDATAAVARAASDTTKLRREHELANERIRLLNGASVTARAETEKYRRRISEISRERDDANAAAQSERERAALIHTQYDVTHNAYEQRVAHILAAQRDVPCGRDTADAVQSARDDERVSFESRLIDAQRRTDDATSALDAETIRHRESTAELTALRQTLDAVKRDYSERLHERDDVVVRQSALAAELFRVQSELTECRSEYDRAAEQLRTAKSDAAMRNDTVSLATYEQSRRQVHSLLVELANVKFAQKCL